MKVSVIITVYNLEKFVEKTLYSVFNQTYNNIEIIVINDCSTDNSEKIILKYKDKIKYVKLEENSGVLLATCEGLKKSTGEIVTFLDGDDLWCNTKIEEIVSKYNTDLEYVLVTHDYNYINEFDDEIDNNDFTQQVYYKDEYLNDIMKTNNYLKEGIMKPEGRIWLGSAFSINLRKFNVDQFVNFVDNLPYPKLTYQDWPLASYVLASTDGKYGYINKKLFSYRLHSYNYSGGSEMDLQKSIRVAEKGLYTSKAIEEIFINQNKVMNKDELNETLKFRRSMINEYEYLICLYNKNFFKAFKLFNLLSRTHWSYSKRRKNLLRLLSYIIFGRYYFKVKNFFSSLRLN